MSHGFSTVGWLRQSASDTILTVLFPISNSFNTVQVWERRMGAGVISRVVDGTKVTGLRPVSRIKKTIIHVIMDVGLGVCCLNVKAFFS